MNKKTRLLMIMSCIPLLIAAKTGKNFQVNGVRGHLLTNIQERLTELTQNKSLSNESYEDLKSQIKQAMAPYGFFSPSIRIFYQPNKVIFNINPGPRVMVTKLAITIKGEGQDNAKIASAIQELPIAQGKPFNSSHYEKAKQNLIKAAESDGYLHASFTTSEVLINKNNHTAEITLLLNTGPQYYFGQIRFDPSYINPELLHRYVPFKYGQPYSPDKVLEFNNYLSGSGYFKAISVQPQQHPNSSIIPLYVHLKNASRVHYALGLGYGTDTGARGRAGVSIIPVNRSGHKFNAAIIGSANENSLQAQYIIPGKNPIVDQYEALSSFSNLNYDAGKSNSFLFSLAQRHNLPNFQRVLSLNILQEKGHYERQITDIYQPEFNETILFPKATFTWINKSDQLFSPTGYKFSLTGLGATQSLLSSINFVQGIGEARAAYTFEPIRTRFYLHAIQGFTSIKDINDLPLSLAFLLGGADNLRGYKINSIRSGKNLSYGGFEIQKETFKNWYLTSFFDIGSVYNHFRYDDVKRDIGVGMMWVSPVGPIKIGVAQAIEANFKFKHRSPRLVINIGPDL